MVASVGGTIQQEILIDRWPQNFWRDKPLTRFAVQIFNSSLFRELTGINPPRRSINALQYKLMGLPHFTQPSSEGRSVTMSCNEITAASTLKPRKSPRSEASHKTKPPKIVAMDPDNPSRAYDTLQALDEVLKLNPNDESAVFEREDTSNEPRRHFNKLRKLLPNKEKKHRIRSRWKAFILNFSK